jgi:uncharacterized protein YdiU (UPF0061 family)
MYSVCFNSSVVQFSLEIMKRFALGTALKRRIVVAPSSLRSGTAQSAGAQGTRDLISKLKDWIINNTFNRDE